MKPVQHTIESCLNNLENPKAEAGQKLCADQAYRGRAVQEFVENLYAYKLLIKSRSGQTSQPNTRPQTFRWALERSNSWLNRFPEILIRWEKKAANHLAAIELVTASHVRRRAGGVR